MVRIKNLQNRKTINQSKIRGIITIILSYLKIPDKSLSLVLCDNALIRRLNRKYFNKNSPTDVIAFPLNDKFSPSFLGEIIISIEETLKNSRVYETSFNREFKLYLIHGILHLLGYSDRKNKGRALMEKKQEEIILFLGEASRNR
ncbi:MAG: rRNA maturation RNase YbeY [Candidatus Omnitrophota bacterium]